MTINSRIVAVAGGLLMALTAAQPSIAQKRGGVLRMYTPDSPASMSVLEEATVFSRGPMMGVFNNLVMFDQQVKQNSIDSIVADLATSWSWNEEGTELTFPLRQGVKWHDGKPFTAADVKCTWDLLMDRATEKLRVNPRKSAFANVEQVSTNGDYEVTFHLKRPQPAFLMLIANDFSEILPAMCRHARCASIRSAPAHSNSSSSSQTNT
jgi:peptide/nickel transport system substrate-binding protein